MRRRLAFLGVSLAAAGAMAAPASANTFVPTRFGDPIPGKCKPHDCSLREAVIAANHHPGTDTILLGGGRYNLQQAGSNEEVAVTGDLDVRDSLTIRGRAGDPRPTIDGNDLDRIFDVRFGKVQLNLDGLVLKAGNAGGSTGGAISESFSGTGGLRIVNCELAGNKAPGGTAGAVYAANPVTIARSSFIRNADSSGAGAVYGSFIGKRISIARSLFKGNDSGNVGAVRAEGRVSIIRSSFINNGDASSSTAGALYDGYNYPVSISRTSFTANKSNDIGAAYVSGRLTISRSSFSQNGGSAASTAGAFYNGSSNPVSISRTSFTANKSNDIGAAYISGPLTIARSSFSQNGGSAASTAGAFYNGSSNAVKIFDSRVTGNKSATTGGVHTSGPTTVRRSTFKGNQTDGGAGGLDASSGLLKLSSSRLIANAGKGAGGVHVGDAANVDRTSISRNDGGPGSGGGIDIGSGAVVTVSRSTISGNRGENGGGIGNFGALTLVNDTISGNTATGYGGGIASPGGASVTMNNVTVARNIADSNKAGGESGGGIYANAASYAIQNSIIAGNTVGSGATSDCYNANVASGGHNLIGNPTGCSGFGVNGDILNKPAKLGPLADNGGPTLTRALKPGSLAIDHGAHATPGSGGNACAKHDQRGVRRPQGVRCDIGAFERRH